MFQILVISAITVFLLWLDYIFAIPCHINKAKPVFYGVGRDDYFYKCKFDELNDWIELSFLPSVNRPLRISTISKKPPAISILLYRSLSKDQE